MSVTPDFMKGGPVDISKAETTASDRKKIYTVHRSQEDSFRLVNTTIDEDWGLGDMSWNFDLQNMCNQDCIMEYQRKAMMNYFRDKLSKEDCLKRYLTAFGSRQDILVVSTVDTLNTSKTLDATESGNSLLFFANFTGFPSNGRYWQCGSTNTMDCRKRDGFTTTELDSWNIIGYKIDYCLSSERSLENHCKLNYNTPFLISMLSGPINHSKEPHLRVCSCLRSKSLQVHWVGMDCFLTVQGKPAMAYHGRRCHRVVFGPRR